MKGVVYLGDSAVDVVERAKPEPGPGQVLVEMKVAGLCGSDLHKYHRDKEWAAERHGMFSGHEPAGGVAALGSGVSGLAVGDRLCVYHSLGCGHCRHCLSGEPVFCANEGAFGRTCDGCHADFMLTEAKYCLPLPDELSFEVGAMLACTAGTAYAALHKLPFRLGDEVAVFGLGPVGLTAALMAQAAGVRSIGVEVQPYRLELARKLGLETVVDGGQTDGAEAILDLTGGRGANGIVECSGAASARSQTAQAAAHRGHIVIVGAGAEQVCLDETSILRKELTIRGNAVYSMAAYFDAAQFLIEHRVPLDDMVTHRFRIEQAREAFEVFDAGETGKVVFEWSAD